MQFKNEKRFISCDPNLKWLGMWVKYFPTTLGFVPVVLSYLSDIGKPGGDVSIIPPCPPSCSNPILLSSFSSNSQEIRMKLVILGMWAKLNPLCIIEFYSFHNSDNPLESRWL